MTARTLFATNLRRVRVANRLSMRRLGDAVGVTSATVCYYESGRTEPTAARVFQLAWHLDVPVDELFREIR